MRPLNEKEIAEGEKSIISSPDEFTLAHPWKDEKSKQHIYDRVFDKSASQDDVFEDTKVAWFLKLKPFLEFYHSFYKQIVVYDKKSHPCRQLFLHTILFIYY